MTFGLTCLIPAYNEAPRIGNVLRALTAHPALDALVVIDDGSTDGTAEIARKQGARVLQGPGNSGKTKALMMGLAEVRTSHVLLLDADLTGLTAADVTALIQPVAEGRAAASMSLRGNAPRTWRLLGVDYISGERVIPTDLMAGHGATLSKLPRFGFEVFLNRLLILRRDPVAVVHWPQVASPSKASKRGILRGVSDDGKMIADILRTISLAEMLSQISTLRRMNQAARVSSQPG